MWWEASVLFCMFQSMNWPLPSSCFNQFLHIRISHCFNIDSSFCRVYSLLLCGFSDMKNLIGEAECNICKESYSTTVTGEHCLLPRRSNTSFVPSFINWLVGFSSCFRSFDRAYRHVSTQSICCDFTTNILNFVSISN